MISHKMKLIRFTEEEIIRRYPKQLMRCPTHLSIGQEAAAVGVCHNLRQTDLVFSTHRCHAHYLAKGGDLKRMALELHGKVGGCLDGRGGSMHLMDKSVGMALSVPIVASAIPLALGAAMAKKLNEAYDDIVVVFFGDAALEEGVFHESLNFASLMKLPIIFVCENNNYSIETPIQYRQPGRSFITLGDAHNMYSYVMPGNDVFAVEKKFRQVIADVRRGIPALICLKVRRMIEHCGMNTCPKFDSSYADPMTFLPKDSEIDDKLRQEICDAFDEAEAAPLPTPDMAKEYVYA